MLSKRESLSALLTNELRRKIQDGTYKPGDRIPTEGELCAEHGVSRTVVREAVASLRADGLLRSRQGIGVFVNKASALRPFLIPERPSAAIVDMLHILELRLSVEVEAAAAAARRRTEEQLRDIREICDRIDAVNGSEGAVDGALDFGFHMAVARASNNPYLAKFLEFLGPQILIPRMRFGTREDDALLTKWRLEHRAVLDAIAAGDQEGSRLAMRTHLSDSMERYRGSDAADAKI